MSILFEKFILKEIFQLNFIDSIFNFKICFKNIFNLYKIQPSWLYLFFYQNSGIVNWISFYQNLGRVRKVGKIQKLKCGYLFYQNLGGE